MSIFEDLYATPVTHGEISYLWLGQGSFGYKFGNEAVILVDPYLSDIVEKQDGLTRIFPFKANPGDVKADAVLITHDHLDHYDPETVPHIAEKGIPIYAPYSCRLHYQSQGLPEELFHEIAVGTTFDLQGVSVTTLHAHHPSGDDMWDAVGFIFRYGKKTIYHVGDSELTEEVLRQTKGLVPDVLVVPINGRWGNMNAEEAATLTGSTGARAVIPMHYDLFAENTADPSDFVRAARDRSLACEIRIPTGFSPRGL